MSLETLTRALPWGEAGDGAGARPTSPGRERAIELGVVMIVVALPVAFIPMSAAPFVDVKIVVLLASCLLLWLGGGRGDRTLSLLAAAWVLAMVASSVTGVDRWVSVLGVENLGTGLVLFGPCAYLLSVGSGLPRSVVARIPGWLFGVSIAVSVVAIAWRVAPRVLGAAVPGLSFDGGTLGHPVFVSGILAAGLTAAFALRVRGAWFHVSVVVCASALAISTKRVGLVAIVLGFAIAWGTKSLDRRRAVSITVLVGATILFWTLVGFAGSMPTSGVTRFTQLGTDSARSRIVITEVLARASIGRPVLGWGPGNTWSAFLLTASPDEVDLAKRGVADAHDLPLGLLVTSGVVGFLPFAAIVVVVAGRARRAGPELGLTAAVLAALAALHLLQPANVALTPLMFLVAGVVSGAAPPGPRSRHRRSVNAAIGASLIVGLGLSLALVTSSVLGEWGRTYNSTWALRASVTLGPTRISAVRTLALYLAQDGTAGDAASKRQARRLVADTVARHPLYPAVRYLGVDVGLVSNDLPYAREWLRRQVELFPGDVASLSPEARAFLETGLMPDAGAGAALVVPHEG